MLTVNDTSLYTIHFTIFLFTWRADKETYKYFDITETTDVKLFHTHKN